MTDQPPIVDATTLPKMSAVAVEKAKEKILQGELSIEWNDGFRYPIAIDVYNPVDPWVAQCDIKYSMPGDGWGLDIPKWFRCDGASVPRLLWLILGFSPTDPALLAAFPHDFSYRSGRRRVLADALLYAGLLDLNPHPTTEAFRRRLWIVRSWLMYLGVRIFGGWNYWRAKKRREAAKAADLAAAKAAEPTPNNRIHKINDEAASKIDAANKERWEGQ